MHFIIDKLWVRLSYPWTGNHPGDKVNQAAQAENISERTVDTRTYKIKTKRSKK